MSDPPIEGSLARPVSLDPFQNITNVSWGGGIAVLSIDAPDSVFLTIDPSPSYLSKVLGDTIARADFTQGVSSVFTLGSEPILRKLYGGEEHKLWDIIEKIRVPGDDPGSDTLKYQFMIIAGGSGGITPDNIDDGPHKSWETYATYYDLKKAKYDGIKGSRWVVVSDLASLGTDTVYGAYEIGPKKKYTWGNYPYIVDSSYGYFKQRLESTTTNMFGMTIQHWVNDYFDDPQPLNNLVQIAYSQFRPSKPTSWGLGEMEDDTQEPILNLVRRIYLLDFKILKGDSVAISNDDARRDDKLGELDMVFQLTFYPGGTAFTVAADSLTADHEAVVPVVSRTASYYKSGALFTIDRKGFV
jgi:hypothetical protein